MKQPDLLHGVYRKPDPSDRLRIVKRLGDKATHFFCHCPLHLPLIIEPVFDGQGVLFAVQTEVQNLNPRQRDALTDTIHDMDDGSGGIAPYEDFGVINQRDAFVRSLAGVSIQTGVIFLDDGAIQEPLFSMPDPLPPTRWSIDDPAGR